MANFTKIFGLAGVALISAGLSYGQTVCSSPAAAPQLIRQEGTTEQVGDFTFSCTGAGSANLLVSVSLPVTSKVLGSANGTSYSEALALVNGVPAAQGAVNGSQITFAGVTLPAAASTITITNVRVNANSLTVGSGSPPPVTESVFISGAGITTAALGPVNVAFALAGLNTAIIYKSLATPQTGASKGTNSFVICSSIGASSANGGSHNGILSVIDFGEGFNTAFKGQHGTAPGVVPAVGTNSTAGSEFTNNTETGFEPAAFPTVAGSNTATSATEFQIVFSNVPANLTLYLPVSVATDQTVPATAPAGSSLGTLTLISASGSAITAATASSSITAGTAAITASSGTATAYYLFTPGTLSSTTSETFAVPAYGVANANSITATTTAVTAAVSFFPIGASAPPSFTVTSSTVPQTLSTFSGCTTSLLFPFITNQVGFDTGIAIANTSTDPFGTKGATPQAGTCSLNFYGAGAPSPNSLTTANVPSGTVYTGVLSGLAAGFQGYMIAQCNFQFAHGFAFITDGVGASGGLSQGYLAGVIPDVNQLPRAASPLSAAPANTGETLGN